MNYLIAKACTVVVQTIIAPWYGNDIDMQRLQVLAQIARELWKLSKSTTFDVVSSTLNTK
jgi:hypothetical protein